MRAKDLRPLQPFIDAVRGYNAVLAQHTSSCRCTLNEAGRWSPPAAGCVGERRCKQVLHIIVRVHLAQLRMPVDHITDPELDAAVDQLQTLCFQAPALSQESFAAGINDALHGERITADTP